MLYSKQKDKYNKRERYVQDFAKSCGYDILYKGWPDFLFYKKVNGKLEAFFIEIKQDLSKNSKYLNTYLGKLSPEQEEMHRVLKELGLNVKVIRIP
ncbi:MAG: hypothetical protein M0R17_14270 [Candidatus Omnitrophica bacterium]|jgi:hypothetical protein|nr:hypothetical protein [Candidatus Omnitrophota bacterium]